MNPLGKGTGGRCTPFLFPRGKRNAVPAKRKTARGVPIPPLHPPQTAKRGPRPPFGISPAACGPKQDGSYAEDFARVGSRGAGALLGRSTAGPGGRPGRAFPGGRPSGGVSRAGPRQRPGRALLPERAARAHSASPVRRGKGRTPSGMGDGKVRHGQQGGGPAWGTGGNPPESFPPFVIRQRGPPEGVPSPRGKTGSRGHIRQRGPRSAVPPWENGETGDHIGKGGPRWGVPFPLECEK